MAPFTITHPGGTVTKRFDQRATLTDWRLLGTYTFLPGEPAKVTLENAINDPSDYVIADAIRWRWAGDPGIATWAFTVAQAGSHDVYARWVAAAGNAPDAKYTVHHDGGATLVAVDQRHRSGERVKLGSFAFAAGDYWVELSDQASGLVTADAVYVVPTPSGDPDSYTWTPTIAATADYQVYARWTAGPDRAANAEYAVETPSGLDLVTVSQRQGGGAWNLLGTFALEAGTGNRIVLNAAAADGTVVADAIRIVRAVAAGEIAYVHTDHLGQPRKLTDATASLLWDRMALPFGATHSEAGLGETSLRFPGQWADAESGLHYNYFRDYDPSLGRYIESDPIGLAGGLNTYGYVGGNPVSKTDPTGENPIAVGAGGGAVLAGPPGAAVGAAVGAAIVGGYLVYEYCTQDGADEDECEKQYERDIFECKMFGKRSCYEQAAKRYAACLRGQPLPPLNH